jgi:hypothetical protein
MHCEHRTDTLPNYATGGGTKRRINSQWEHPVIMECAGAIYCRDRIALDLLRGGICSARIPNTYEQRGPSFQKKGLQVQIAEAFAIWTISSGE